MAVNAPICFKEQEIRNVGYVLKLFLAQKCGTFLVRLAFDRQPRSERTILHGHWQFDESEKTRRPPEIFTDDVHGPQNQFRSKDIEIAQELFCGIALPLSWDPAIWLPLLLLIVVLERSQREKGVDRFTCWPPRPSISAFGSHHEAQWNTKTTPGTAPAPRATIQHLTQKQVHLEVI